ncbi:MAG: hypothetical protein NVSMB33_08220 [Ktedonobacteraceae bacterium]
MEPDPTKSESTYVMDAESATELVRITKQDALVTTSMGSLLPPQVRPETISTILDVACGPGSWVLDVAYEYPKTQVTGIDISRNSIEYARARARTQGLENNTTFEVMDATRRLKFPDQCFDLINCRFLVGFMAPANWPDLLHECIRITRPGGFIRLTECDDLGPTNSSAFERLAAIGSLAFKKAGRSFSPEAKGAGITPMMTHFLSRAGYQPVEMRPYVIDYSAGTAAHVSMYENWRAGFKLLQPFVVKMEVVTSEEAEELYQQALAEMMSDDFRALWYFLSVVGQRPI